MTRREPAEPPTDLGRPWAGGLTERVRRVARQAAAPAAVAEELGSACGSSALVFGMHCVASRVIAARPRPAQVERLLRDARAAHLMSPTTDRLETWLGRSLLGLPLP